MPTKKKPAKKKATVKKKSKPVASKKKTVKEKKQRSVNAAIVALIKTPDPEGKGVDRIYILMNPMGIQGFKSVQSGLDMFFDQFSKIGVLAINMIRPSLVHLSQTQMKALATGDVYTIKNMILNFEGMFCDKDREAAAKLWNEGTDVLKKYFEHLEKSQTMPSLLGSLINPQG